MSLFPPWNPQTSHAHLLNSPNPPSSCGRGVKADGGDDGRQPDEGGQLHGARHLGRAPSHSLLARLGREALLAARVLHAHLPLWQDPPQTVAPSPRWLSSVNGSLIKTNSRLCSDSSVIWSLRFSPVNGMSHHWILSVFSLGIGRHTVPRHYHSGAIDYIICIGCVSATFAPWPAQVCCYCSCVSVTLLHIAGRLLPRRVFVLHKMSSNCQYAGRLWVVRGGLEVKGEPRLSKVRVASSNVRDYTMPPVPVKHLAISTVDLDSADTHAAHALARYAEASSCLSLWVVQGDPPERRRQGLQLGELQPW